MRIWFFNHYAQPPEKPGGTRHYDLSLCLKSLGCDVKIFSSSFHYTLLKEQLSNFKLFFESNFNGVDFILLRTISYKRNNFRRFLNILSYPISLVIYLLFSRSRIERPNIIIGSTVHPFSSLFGCIIAKIYKVPHVFEIRDLWPESFIDMGLWRRDSFISNFFYAIEKFTVKYSQGYIVLSPMTVNYLCNKYNIRDDKILVLPNGVNENFYNHLPSNLTVSSDDKFIIKYVGGIDSVHGLEFLIDIAFYLNNDYQIILVGDGKDKQRLVSKVKSLNINNVIFLPPIAKNCVPNELANSDLLFLSTADVYYGSENKLYEYMSAAKPIIVASNAEHNNPVHELGCGIVLDRNNALDSSVNLKKYISENYKEFNKIGLNGYNYVINNRTSSKLASKLFDFLSGVKL